MLSKENFSFYVIALSVGYAMFALLSFKLAVDMHIASISLYNLKLPVETLLIVFGISFVNWRNWEQLILGSLVGVVGGLYFFLTNPGSDYIYSDSFAVAVFKKYGLVEFELLILRCSGLVIAVMLNAIGLICILRLMYTKSNTEVQKS